MPKEYKLRGHHLFLLHVHVEKPKEAEVLRRCIARGISGEVAAERMSKNLSKLARELKTDPTNTRITLITKRDDVCKACKATACAKMEKKNAEDDRGAFEAYGLKNKSINGNELLTVLREHPSILAKYLAACKKLDKTGKWG